MTNYCHIIIIRFSVNFINRVEFKNKESSLFDHQRLENRIKLFEMFCLRGLISQTLKDFKTIILYDENLPKIFLDKLGCLTTPHNFILLHRWDKRDRLSNNDWLREYVDNDKKFLITTRLDDDDILNKDINSTFKDFFSKKPIRKIVDSCISFTGGKFIDYENTSLKIFKSNYKTPGVFLSYITKIDSQQNIFSQEHDNIKKKVRVIKMKDCWGILNHIYENDNRFLRFKNKEKKLISLEEIYKIFI
jgi:hypothetical protein